MASATVPDTVVSHWSTLIENFQVSPLAFYGSVEEALARRDVPQTTNSRVDYREAGALSANREYLHVTREKLIFDICAAPFGTGFFVSYWLAENPFRLNPFLKVLCVLVMLGLAGAIVNSFGVIMGLLVFAFLVFVGLMFIQLMADGSEFNDDIVRALPILGPLYVWLFKPATYYRIDSMLMFQKAVHNAVLEVIDTMTAEKGIRALSDCDRKPTMREFYGGKAA